MKEMFAAYLLGAAVCASFINGEMRTVLDDADLVWVFVVPWWVMLIVAVSIACWPAYILIRATVHLCTLIR